MKTALLASLLLCALVIGYAESVVSVPIIGFGFLVYLTAPLRWQWRLAHLALAACTWSLASTAPLSVLMAGVLISHTGASLIHTLVSRRYQAVLAAVVFVILFSYFQPLIWRNVTINEMIIQSIILLIVVRQFPLGYFSSSQRKVLASKATPLSSAPADTQSF